MKGKQPSIKRHYPGDLDELAVLGGEEIGVGKAIEEEVEGQLPPVGGGVPEKQSEDEGGEDEDGDEEDGVVDNDEDEEGEGQGGEKEGDDDARHGGQDRAEPPPSIGSHGEGKVVHPSPPSSSSSSAGTISFRGIHHRRRGREVVRSGGVLFGMAISVDQSCDINVAVGRVGFVSMPRPSHKSAKDVHPLAGTNGSHS
ncbi:hypothetical protein BHM03_00000452 [Ensete ventricosum]|uniref:Uncharacterized protein n=1 Tax=Ensete ventricosum TaxID=4639 RepID=A0A445M8K6_ENSVE|nr:hypothetical protein BHM03_00000452 [Ensete ventricosum]